MKILERIILILVAACQVGSSGFSSVVIRTVRRIWLTTWLLAIAVALLLGSMGLAIAALFIGLTPHLGAHWAALIAAGVSLAASGIFLAFALRVAGGSRSR